jgi:hypothetical protein
MFLMRTEVDEKQTQALDWRAAAEARGRAAFEAAVAAEPESQPTPARRAARRPVTKRKPAAKGE